MSVLRAELRGAAGKLAIDVALELARGPLVLVGPNGAGKTSLLRMLLGAITPREGRIAIGDEALFDRARGIDVPLEARGIGYVPQSYALFPHMTVRQNVELAASFARDPSARGRALERAQALIDELELRALVSRPASVLSGGEQQRVALARALAAAPRALLLDEPLSALDIPARRSARAFLSERLRKLALPTLVVTHDAADARALGERIAVIEAGRFVQQGTWAELQRAPASDFVRELVAS